MGKVTFTETECHCQICMMMCINPCWGTPEEMQKIIDAGYSNRLRMHIEAHNDTLVYLIVPKDKGGWCTFFSDRGNCVLHKKGLKPLEGRVASCKANHQGEKIRDYVAETWNNEAAKDKVMDFHVHGL